LDVQNSRGKLRHRILRSADAADVYEEPSLESVVVGTANNSRTKLRSQNHSHFLSTEVH
jgi:hypothetical protein